MSQQNQLVPHHHSIERADQVVVRRVRVVTPGTPVQGPDIALGPEFTVSIRQRRHPSTRTGYVGFSRNAVVNTNTRVEMGNNDSINGLRMNNFKEAWFDATAANTYFEMMGIA
jgi:hypothetical protein